MNSKRFFTLSILTLQGLALFCLSSAQAHPQDPAETPSPEAAIPDPSPEEPRTKPVADPEVAPSQAEPDQDSPPNEKPPNPLKILVTEAGVILDQRRLKHAQLRSALTKTNAKRAMLSAPAHVQFRAVTKVMDALRAQGITDISLAVIKPEEGRERPSEGKPSAKEAHGTQGNQRPPKDS